MRIWLLSVGTVLVLQSRLPVVTTVRYLSKLGCVDSFAFAFAFGNSDICM